MKGKGTERNKIISGILMLLALAWLTVCLPYVNESQNIGKQMMEQSSTDQGPEEDNTNPLSNTTEEKTEGGAATPSEYLHDAHHMVHHFTTVTTYYKCHPSDLYFAFHPELISPPPEA